MGAILFANQQNISDLMKRKGTMQPSGGNHGHPRQALRRHMIIIGGNLGSHLVSLGYWDSLVFLLRLEESPLLHKSTNPCNTELTLQLPAAAAAAACCTGLTRQAQDTQISGARGHTSRLQQDPMQHPIPSAARHTCKSRTLGGRGPAEFSSRSHGSAASPSSSSAIVHLSPTRSIHFRRGC